MLKSKKMISLLVCIILLLTAVSCANETASTPPTPSTSDPTVEETPTQSETPAEKIPLNISHHPYLHALPSIYAEKHGMYDMFDYTMTMYSGGPTQNEAIASNQWEVGTTGTGGALLGAVGYDLKVIGFTATDSNTVDLWVRPDSPLLQAEKHENGVYGNAEDWKGKKILCPTGTSTHMVLIGTLEYLGLNQSDVEVTDMAVAQSFPAFKADQGDIVALWSPFGFAAEKEGWVKVSSAQMLGINLPCLIVATNEAVQNRPEVVQQWLQVYVDATREMLQDKAAAAELLFEFEKQEGIKMEEDVSVMEVENRPFPDLEENKALFKMDSDGNSEAREILLKFADFMISQGKMTQADKQRIIDNGFVDGSFMQNVN